MHDVGVATLRDQVLRRLALAAGVQHGAGAGQGLRLEDRVLDAVIIARVRKPVLFPQAVDDFQPFGGARVPVLVLLEMHAVLPRLVGPPGGHDVERQAARRAADVVDVRRLLGQQRGRMERRAHGDHQFEPFRDRRQGCGRAPGVERGGVGALDVVEVQLGDEGQVVADLFAAARQPADVVPRGFHALVLHVAKPAAEDGEPIAVAHRWRGCSGNAVDLGFRGNRPAARADRSRSRAGRPPRNSRARSRRSTPAGRRGRRSWIRCRPRRSRLPAQSPRTRR